MKRKWMWVPIIAIALCAIGFSAWAGSKAGVISHVRRNLDEMETYVGQFHILQGVSFEIQEGNITVLFGRNGAGKTTTLRSIMGFHQITKGHVTFKGDRLNGLPTHAISRKGIGYVPENQGIFHHLTVEENFF